MKTSTLTRREYVRLFWSVGALDATVIEVISEWVESRNQAKYEVILDLVAEAPRGIPFTYPDFARRLLDNAKQFGGDMPARALGRMLWNVTPRSYAGSMTGPPPVWVNLEQQAAEFAIRYESIPTLRTLYGQIRQLAIHNIETALKQSEQFRERHE